MNSKEGFEKKIEYKSYGALEGLKSLKEAKGREVA
jgi:hypothetical protein